MKRSVRSDRISDEVVLQQLRNLYEKLGKIPTYKEIGDAPNMLSARGIVRHFGSTNKAIELALGFKIPKSHRYSKNMVKRDILRINKLLGRVPTKEEFDSYRKTMSSSRIKGRFGWNNILKELNIKAVKAYYSKEELVNILKNLGKKLNRPPIISDLDGNKFPAFSVFFDKFGSWNGALKEASFETKPSFYIAKDGHKCWSVMELYVDNWFVKNGINHKKDVFYPYHLEFNPNNRKTCDWVLEDGHWVELFGLMRRDEYREKKEIKEELCKVLNIDLITLFPTDLGNLGRKL